VKTLLKSVHIYQSYCKKNLAQFFLAHPVQDKHTRWCYIRWFYYSIQVSKHSYNVYN